VGKVIGIDLGTTNCCVAVMEGGKPRVVTSREGGRTTPSVVAFTPRGERLVGQIAKRQALTNPQNTIYAVKRLIGRKYDSLEVARAKQLVRTRSCRRRTATRGSAFGTGTSRRRAVGVPALEAPGDGGGLRRRRDQRGDHHGARVLRRLPAASDEGRGRIAGLNVLRIINEPTAASLAYGLDEGTAPKRIAVYDLGAARSTSRSCRSGRACSRSRPPRATRSWAGDFDQRVVDWLIEVALSESGVDLRADRLALQRLKEAAEKAKCELSREESAEINLPFISADEGGARHLHTVLTRAKFEELVEDLIEKTRGPCEEALRLAGLRRRTWTRSSSSEDRPGRRGWSGWCGRSSDASPTRRSIPTRSLGSGPGSRRGS